MEQVKAFFCTGEKDDAGERMLEEVNKWLKENSSRVIQRSVSQDGAGYPIIFIFYKTDEGS